MEVHLPAHPFCDKKLCKNYQDWINKKKADGTYIEHYKRGNNVNIVPSAAAPTEPPLDMTALMTQMANFCKAAVSKKRLLIDSGCNTTIIASSDHSDDNILYRDYKELIATANGQLIPILGQGSILDVPANYVPLFVDSLISVSQVSKLHNSCVIFVKDLAFNICLTPSIVNLLNQIKSIAVADKLLLCTAPLTADNLYK